jgi:hypothetical protein
MVGGMAYYRVIFSIVYWVEPPPGVHSTCMHVNLDRRGMTLHPTNGRPRPPVKRTIDLRIGDEILFEQQWQKIVEVEVFTDRWFTDEQLPSYENGGDGYVYRAEPQPDSLPLPARIGSKRTRDVRG